MRWFAFVALLALAGASRAQDASKGGEPTGGVAAQRWTYGPDAVRGIAASPDGSLLSVVLAAPSPGVQIVDTRTGTRSDLDLGTWRPEEVLFTRDSKRLLVALSAARERTEADYEAGNVPALVRIVDPRTRRTVRDLSLTWALPSLSARRNDTGSFEDWAALRGPLFVLFRRGTAPRTIDATTGAESAFTDTPPHPVGISVSPDGNSYAYTDGGRPALRRRGEASPVWITPAPPAGGTPEHRYLSATFSPDGARVAVAGQHGKIGDILNTSGFVEVFDVRTRSRLWSFEQEKQLIWPRVAPARDFVAFLCSGRLHARDWSGKPLVLSAPADESVVAVAPTADGAGVWVATAAGVVTRVGRVPPQGVPAATSQEGSLPPVRSVSGQAFGATLRIVATQTITAGAGAQDIEVDMTHDLRIAGLPPDAAGRQRFEVRFERGRVKMSGLGPERIADSDDPMPTAPLERSSRIAGAAWAGTSVRVVMDAAGGIVAFEGVAEAREAAIRKMGLTPAEQTAATQNSFSESRLRGLLEWAFLGLPAVRPGSGSAANDGSWTTQRALPGTAADARVVVSWTHSLSPATDGGVPAIVSKGTPDVSLAGGGSATISDASASGTTRLSPADGLPTHVESTTHYVATLSAGENRSVQMEQTVRTTFARKDAR